MKKLLVLASLLAAVAVAGCGSEEPASAPAVVAAKNLLPHRQKLRKLLRRRKLSKKLNTTKKAKECINLPEKDPL